MKVVLLGAGRVARRHGKLIRALGGDVWIASRDRARAEAVRAATKARGVYAYDEAFAARRSLRPLDEVEQLCEDRQFGTEPIGGAEILAFQAGDDQHEEHQRRALRDPQPRCHR